MDIRVWLSRNRGFAGVLLGMGLVALHVTISRLIEMDEAGCARLDELEAQAARQAAAQPAPEQKETA